MADGRQEFALVGYMEDLEKRPLKFVQPIPAARICSACGNIPRLTYYLLCGHTLCEPCYESCATTSGCVCPLDGDVCVPKDATSKEYPAENLLRRKVHCRNFANGCGVVLPASQLAEHVRNDCQHHVTRCPTCSAVVLSRDVCAHLRSECTALVLHAAPEAQGTDNQENTHLMAFEKNIEQRVGELDAKLAQLALESASQSDIQVEICHNINDLKEALTEEIRRVSVQTLDRLGGNETEMKHALAASEKTIKQQVGELEAKLAQLALESGSQSDNQVEIRHHINNLNEALTEQLRTVSVPTLDCLERNEAEMKHALVASEKRIEQRVGELDAKLDKLSLESGTQRDKLIEVCSNINHLKEGSDRNVAEIKFLHSEQRESLTTAITSVLQSVPRDPKTHQQVIKGYAALKEEALKKGWSQRMSDKVYLRRYLLSWGIDFRNDGNSVNLYLRFQLHEGREDDFLDWPFAKELKLSIIHPDTREERVVPWMPYPTEDGRKCLSRPIGASNPAGYLTDTKVQSSDIEGDGYVKGDQLLVRLEVSL